MAAGTDAKSSIAVAKTMHALVDCPRADPFMMAKCQFTYINLTTGK
jgi:hypothetical protein